MPAAWLDRIGAPLTVGRMPRPLPKPDEVVVAVRAAGVCHTDLHLQDGIPAPPPLPLVPGHEIAGEVVEVGDQALSMRPGQRVLLYYYDGCGSCSWCAQGAENLCPSTRSKWGFTAHGGYAGFIRVPARCCVPLPDDVSYAEAAVLGCSGTTAVHAVRTVAAVRAGERVVVFGVGGVGLAVLQVARATGAHVLAVDKNGDNLAAAARLGADGVVESSRPTSRDLIGGYDVAFDTVGGSATVTSCVELVRPQGRVVVIGYTGQPVPLIIDRLVTREIILRGSVGATLAEAHTAVNLAARGQLKALIADRYSLDEVNLALGRLRSGEVPPGRLVLEP